MSWDVLAAIGTFGQFLVVLAAAFFGYAQIQQLRRQNELQATLPYFAFTRTQAFADAFRLVRGQLDGSGDARLASAIASGKLDDERVLALFQLANFFNEIGVLVQERLIDEATAVPFFRWQIVATWTVMRPYLGERRRTGVPAMWAPFEALALRAEAATDDDRFGRTRRLLPPRLRAEFVRSVAQTARAGGAASEE